jgi:hypothetical protein
VVAMMIHAVKIVIKNTRSSSLSYVAQLGVLTLIITCIVCLCHIFMAYGRVETIDNCTKPRIFVGVFTDGGGVPEYARRRAALRASWFPNTTEALKHVECMYGMTIRFVVGHSPLTNDTRAVNAWHDELSTYDDFLKLDVLDTYLAMTGKTSQMFRHVFSLGPKYEYAVKVDDDMFVSLSHLAKAVDQWADMNADYVGCMKNPGYIFTVEGELNVSEFNTRAFARQK